MRILRIGLHGFALIAIQIFSILAGFALYVLIRAGQPSAPQIAIQGTAAVLLSIAGFIAWGKLTARVPIRWVHIRSWQEWAGVYFAALLWMPLLFIPLHYLTQGYLTSFGNLAAIWLFQIPAGFLAIVAVTRWVGAQGPLQVRSQI